MCKGANKKERGEIATNRAHGKRKANHKFGEFSIHSGLCGLVQRHNESLHSARVCARRRDVQASRALEQVHRMANEILLRSSRSSHRVLALVGYFTS